MTVDVARPEAATSAPDRRGRGRLGRRNALVAYLLLGPNLLLFSVFLLVPLAWVLLLSFQSYSGFGAAEWVGVDNYTTMAKDEVFWRAALNTVVFAAVTVPLSLGLGLAIALLLNRNVPGRGFLRSLYYLPFVVSGVVIAMIGHWIFNEELGVVNKVLRIVGGDGATVGWESEAVPALVSLIVMIVWARLGFVMIIYLAGLQGVPGEYYEAARLDGASAWQQFRYVTWPLLRPTTFFLVVLTIIETFQIFDVVYVMTRGGPGEATQVLVTYAYATGFDARRQGYAAAIGIVIWAVVLVFTVLWWRVQKRRDMELS